MTTAEAPQPRAHPDHGRLVHAAGIAVVLLAVLCAGGLWLVRRAAHTREAARLTVVADKGPRVLVTRVEVAPAGRAITLPADVHPLLEATLYAKISGYVRDVLVDKGARVKKDQVLGHIESPATDQQVLSARADLVYRQQQAARAQRLAPALLSQADLEAALSALDVSRASLAAAVAQQQYETLRAPFDGVVTARYVDPGALLPAPTAGVSPSALPLVDVQDATRLRVYVYVGQDAAPFVRAGDAFSFWQDQHPEVHVEGRVTRVAGALDPRTRTMQVEADVENRVGFLPGTFAHAEIHVASPPEPRIPAEAMFVRGGKNLVAVVRDDSVHFVEVIPGISDGRTLSIQRGLSGNEVVALDMPIEIADGARVQPVMKGS